MSLQPTANTTNGSILRSHALNLHVSDQMFKNTHRCFENPASNLVTSWKRGGPWLRLLAKLPPSAPAVFLLAPGRANTGDMRRCPKIGDAPNGSKLVLGNYMIIKYWTGFRATFFSINSMFNDGHAHLRLSKRVCHGAARVDINSASHGIFFKTNVSEPYAQNQLRLI